MWDMENNDHTTTSPQQAGTNVMLDWFDSPFGGK